jgi:deazaflavin-dependent oxidoreductase (nitroreductase family)
VPEFTKEQFDDFNGSLVEEFRANGGKVSGQFAGAPLLLLTTVGAKSGKERVNPLAYHRDGDRLAIVASFGGAPTNPAWYHNLLANPKVTVEVGGETFTALATPAEGAERDRLFADIVAAMPNFGEYQKNTDRTIPIVFLDRQ